MMLYDWTLWNLILSRCRGITILNSNNLNEEHISYNITEFINYILAKLKVVNDAMRSEWFFQVKKLFQQVRFLI